MELNVGGESFTYLRILSDFEKYGIIDAHEEDSDYWYQSLLTKNYYLMSKYAMKNIYYHMKHFQNCMIINVIVLHGYGDYMK